MKQTRCKLSAEMLECLLFTTSPAVENINSTCTEAANYVFFGRFYVKKTWQRIVFAYSASRIFFGGFSADENSAANTANGAGLGSISNRQV